MQYVEAPQGETPRHKSLFLGGGITGCPNWQAYVADALRDYDITVFNPRRERFPRNPHAIREQIRWEYAHLRRADVVAFWFSEGSLNPIALFELGSAMERAISLVIGVHPEYTRRADVEIQVSLRRPEISVCHALDDLVAEIRRNCKL